MPLATSLSQATLAITILASTIGTYLALSPPNPSATAQPATGDFIRWLKLTNRYSTEVAFTPLALLALHTFGLTIFRPNIPRSILRHGLANALNPHLTTWSAATAIPLCLILCVGIPLRLVSYASLGRNFTFALKEPDRLTTTGIYHHVQHPSYMGIMVLLLCNAALLCRTDGVLSCWVPPRWYRGLCRAYLALAPVALAMLCFGLWTRVREEERMLWMTFDGEWESWHAGTSRFIPWLL